MLMFQNGLLATFIPEILMVIGFVLCLFTPGYKSNNSRTEQTPIVAHVASFEQRQTITYELSIRDFQAVAESVQETVLSLQPYIDKQTPNRFEFKFSTSVGLSFVDFSRPPPSFIS